MSLREYAMLREQVVVTFGEFTLITLAFALVVLVMTLVFVA